MNFKEARRNNYDIHFFGSEEERESYAKSFTKVTGQQTFNFEEDVMGHTLICLATAPRPSPHR